MTRLEDATVGGISVESGTKEGGVKNQITKGEFVLRGIDHIDEEKGKSGFRQKRQESRSGPLFCPSLCRELRWHRSYRSP